MTNSVRSTPGARKTVLVLGATSAIARSVAEQLGKRGFDLILAGRDVQEIEALARDLEVRSGVRAVARRFDALSFDSHRSFLEECRAVSDDTLFGVVMCFGYLGDQKSAEHDFGEARRILETNFLAAVSVLNLAAQDLEGKGEGFLCALSSVAGDRGRQSNYLYGAAKAGLTVYLQGLRNRLSRSGVRVITIKPGFVDTQMTFGRPGLFLVTSPEAAARQIVGAILGGKDVRYVPGFWRLIMIAVRAIPERIFKRMKL
jgi:short-subunit dehydrogenase